jgi:hypothetical protein
MSQRSSEDSKSPRGKRFCYQFQIIWLLIYAFTLGQDVNKLTQIFEEKLPNNSPKESKMGSKNSNRNSKNSTEPAKLEEFQVKALEAFDSIKRIVVSDQKIQIGLGVFFLLLVVWWSGIFANKSCPASYTITGIEKGKHKNLNFSF